MVIGGVWNRRHKNDFHPSLSSPLALHAKETDKPKTSHWHDIQGTRSVEKARARLKQHYYCMVYVVKQLIAVRCRCRAWAGIIAFALQYEVIVTYPKKRSEKSRLRHFTYRKQRRPTNASTALNALLIAYLLP